MKQFRVNVSNKNQRASFSRVKCGKIEGNMFNDFLESIGIDGNGIYEISFSVSKNGEWFYKKKDAWSFRHIENGDVIEPLCNDVWKFLLGKMPKHGERYTIKTKKV